MDFFVHMQSNALTTWPQVANEIKLSQSPLCASLSLSFTLLYYSSPPACSTSADVVIIFPLTGVKTGGLAVLKREGRFIYYLVSMLGVERSGLAFVLN